MTGFAGTDNNQYALATADCFCFRGRSGNNRKIMQGDSHHAAPCLYIKKMTFRDKNVAQQSFLLYYCGKYLLSGADK